MPRRSYEHPLPVGPGAGAAYGAALSGPAADDEPSSTPSSSGGGIPGPQLLNCGLSCARAGPGTTIAAASRAAAARLNRMELITDHLPWLAGRSPTRDVRISLREKPE